MIPERTHFWNRPGLPLTLIFGCITLPQMSLAQEGTQPALPKENVESSGPTIGQVIASIAEKPSQEAADFEQLAQMTLQIGQSALQQGQRIVIVCRLQNMCRPFAQRGTPITGRNVRGGNNAPPGSFTRRVRVG